MYMITNGYILARDKMSQTALINRNLLDYFFLGHFMKKRCWMFKD